MSNSSQHTKGLKDTQGTQDAQTGCVFVWLVWQLYRWQASREQITPRAIPRQVWGVVPPELMEASGLLALLNFASKGKS